MMAESNAAISLFSDTFGNWMLRDTVPINLPDNISYWPQTVGWLVLAVIFALFVGRYAQLKFKQYWRNRYRKQYLHKLNKLDVNDLQGTPRAIHQLLQQACLHAYPQTLKTQAVSRLHGDALLVFLDSAAQGQTEFDTDLGQSWQRALYLPLQSSRWSVVQNQILLLLAQRWLTQHAEQGHHHD